MATTENSALYYEVGQVPVLMTQLEDDGDHKTFSSDAECWSDEAGFSPVIKPDGVLTGLVISVSTDSNKVNVSAGTLNLAGIATTQAGATGLTCVRGSSLNICSVNSITVTSAGALAVVTGTAGTASTEVRGAAGGPPFIPVGSVEIGQVRFTSITAALVLASEIFVVPNTHRESAHYPVVFSIDYFREEEAILQNAGVTFSCALMLNHTASVAKGVFAQYYEPEFVEIGKASDFQPASNSLTSSSQPYYGGAIGEVSITLRSGKFKAFLDNGISDPILAKEGKKIWFKYLVDRYRPENYILTQGFLGVTAQYPAKGSIFADFSINAIDPGKRITG